MGRGKSATGKAIDKARKNTSASKRASEIAPVQIKAMRGSEKQIAYANDIINAPVETIKLHISFLERMKDTHEIYRKTYNDRVPRLLNAVAEYRNAVNNRREFENAAFVIENKYAFKAAMRNCVQKAFRGTNYLSTIVRNVGL